MPCTTILVGRKASYDGSTIIARNDDSGAGYFTPKKFTVVLPEKQPRHYRSVLSHVEVELPDHPMRYTATPNAIPGKGIWAAAGVNEANVAMTATETSTSNERILGADPLVKYQPARGEEGSPDFQPEIPGGIGEEDLVVLTLPYIHSAREGVARLGLLHETYGTYESNGIAIADVDEIWWFETVGGHHWIARRVPDDSYVTMPNQLGIDAFDLKDALGKQKNFMCSADMESFLEENHLDLSLDGRLNARDTFGSHSDADHCYNTPRAWYMQRFLNPRTCRWDGPDADFTPESDNIPWCRVPERKITVEDVKYILSSYYQGTPYNPYAKYGNPDMRGAYRFIGVNRNDFLGIFQLRPYAPKKLCAVEWIAFASNPFNVLIPQYTNIERTPDYLANTTGRVSTDNFYWASRLIGALADAHYGKCIQQIERYQEAAGARAHELIARFDREYKDAKKQAEENGDAVKASELRFAERANDAFADAARTETDAALREILLIAANNMRNQYARNDH